mmetsp:Transcript_596/g.1236  ORF Transcript_596/g.1236 Transcript_596/m.1236 type:complete len:94 (-) Transcript_596:127-408(-)
MFQKLRARAKGSVDAAKDAAEDTAEVVQAASDDMMDKVEDIKEQIEEVTENMEAGAFFAKLKLCIDKHLLCCMYKEDEAAKVGAVVDAAMDVV